MKFVISFLICSHAFCSPINLYFEGDKDIAKLFEDRFISKYSIPEELINSKFIKNCTKVKARGKLDLCLKSDGDLYIVSADQNFIKESLTIFQAD